MDYKIDYYKILNVNKDASDVEIKKNYRKLAKENHPDKGGSADKFKQIAEAYEVLSDKDKHLHYDNYGRYDESVSINPFELFETMFRDIGLDNSNIFGGNDLNATHDPFATEHLFRSNIFNMPMETNSFTHVTIIKDGKKYTKTTHNGKTVENGKTKEGYLSR